MNEGHSAFLALEQIRLFMREREADASTRRWKPPASSNVFTTHTPVPAGIDLFDPGLMYHYFSDYCAEVGIDFQQLMALGRRNPLRSRRALLHGRAGAQHFGLPQRRQPPAPRGLAGDVPRPVAAAAGLGGARSPPSPTACTCPAGSTAIWPSSTISTWNRTGASASTIRPSGSRSDDIPDEELLEVHRRRKRRLVTFVRDRQQHLGAAAAGFGGGSAARRRGARSQRVHHRIRAPLRHLQARHAAVPRRGAAEADSAATRICRCRS